MILLIFAVLSLTLISLWLVNELYDTNKLLKEEKEMSEMRRKWADTYWIAYGEACSDKRDLKKEIFRLETELGNVEADLIDERYVIEKLNEEIEKLEGRNKWLQYELENEFEWSMKYSESAERYSALYFDSLEEAEKLKDENKRLKTDLKYYREKYEGNYDPID